MAIQPALGMLHHRHFVVHQGRGAVSHAHIWWGRVVMGLGVINGGIGLQISQASNSIIVAYGVIAAVIFVCYVGAKLATSCRRSRSADRGTKESGHNSPREAHPPRRPFEDDRRDRAFNNARNQQYRFDSQA